MKYRTICYFALVIAISAITTLSPARADDAATASDPAVFARGANAWANQCARCHNIRNTREMDDAGWSIVAAHMRIRGGIPGDMARDIEAFLRASND